ncbi:MAG: succinylglutamate desuccinylase/aspartoacylase family protein [Granulosicoccus sp.]
MNNIRSTVTADIDLDLADSHEPDSGTLLGGTGAQLTVDIHVAGKQHGHLKVSAMTHTRSPYQLRLPVCIIKGQESGPVITLIAGLHGDEYEGTLTLQKMARELTEKDVHGCLILLPSINTHGMKHGMRQNPADGLNLDYAFPGNINGSVSEQLAHEITRHFIEPSDLVVDLRSGGRGLQFIPSAAVRFSSDPERQSSSENAMIAFGAPNSLRLPASASNSCLQGTVSALNKDYVQTELGGGVTYGVQALAIAHAGCLNILRHKGMLSDELQLASTRLLEVRDDSYYVYAPSTGLYEPLVYLGENVWEEEAMANIVSLSDTRNNKVAVQPLRSATMIASHPGGFVNEGDLIAILAEQVQG